MFLLRVQDRSTQELLFVPRSRGLPLYFICRDNKDGRAKRLTFYE